MINEIKKRLGELLIEKQVITQKQLEQALRKQKEMGNLLGSALVELGFVDQESTLLPVVARQQGVECVCLRHVSVSEEAVAKIPSKVARRYNIMPVEYQDGLLTLAMNKPKDILVRDDIKLLLGLDICPVLASQKDIATAINKYYGVGADTIEEIMLNREIEERCVPSLEDIEDLGAEVTIGDFLNQILSQAYNDRATDVHIEPFRDKLIVRFRIDGVLCDIHVPENIKYFKESINSRIKVMCNGNIAEKRRPQDGRFRINIGDISLDIRVSFLPTLFGESVVLRILNTTKLFNFDELNLSSEQQQTLKDLIRLPHGIVFMTGPTGSGKTTTLYSCLSQINTADKKIITLEDPVEYQLSGIVQIQINPSINLTFAKGLRSVLRHDPDVILVGEVRDVETAEIAIQVALTGHLIFSTLHTNNAAGGVVRLLNMGIEPYLITSTVECFIAQRLIRVICPKCKKRKELNKEILKKFGIKEGKTSGLIIYEGKGCEHCNSTGFFGRTAIYEFLSLNDEINKLILKRESTFKIKQKAVDCGMRTLRQSGWDKVVKGVTTPEEIIRVTQERNRRER